MTRFFVFSLCLFAVLKLEAQRTITVLSPGGEPIPGVQINAGQGNPSYATNENGVVFIKNETDLPSTLSFSSMAYSDTSLSISEEDLPLTLYLTEKVFFQTDVLIRTVRANEVQPFTYQDIRKEEIRKENLGQDLPFLLEPSVSAVTTSDAGAGVGYTGIRIRGTDATRINVTINGIPYNDAESQGTFWVNLPDIASSTDNIQIQRGVGTSTNGAAAFGASVSLNTNQIQRKPYAELNNSIGSFNTIKNTIAAGTGLIKNKFAIDARFSNIQSDGYIDRAFADLRSIYLSGTYLGDNSQLTFNYFTGSEVTYQAWYGVFEADLDSNRTINYAGTEKSGEPYDREVDDYRQDHYQLHWNQSFNEKVNLGISLHYTRGQGFFEQYKADQFLPDYGIDPIISGADTITSTDLIRRRWLDNHFYGAVASVEWSHNRGLLTIGGGWNQYDGDHYGDIIWARNAGESELRDRFYENNGLKTDFHVYAKELLKFNKFSLLLDLQYRYIGYNTDGFDIDGRNIQQNNTFHFFNPKVGLNYELSSNSRLYASFALAHREPTRNDFIDAQAGVIPKAEVLRNLETGYRYRSSSLSFEANYYLMHYKNQLVLTGELNDVGTPVRANVDKSYRTGIELSGAYQILPWLRLTSNVTFSVNKIKEFTETVYTYDPNYTRIDSLTITNNYENTDISFSPSWIGFIELAFQPIEGAEIASVNKFVGNQFLDNTSSMDRQLGRYYQSDIRMSYTLNTSVAKEIRLTLLLNNITNKLYESNGYTFRENYLDANGDQSGVVDYNYFYPQAGFNFLLGLDIRF